MAMKTQKTKIFFIDPNATGGPEVVGVDCAISLDGIGAQRDQLDETCLEDDARSFLAGLANPGTVTMGLNFDVGSDSHEKLINLWKSGDKFELAIGFGDGSSIPTIDTAGLFDLPTDRSFIVLHQVYVADFSMNFALNALVTANVVFQQSGYPDVFRKV